VAFAVMWRWTPGSYEDTPNAAEGYIIPSEAHAEVRYGLICKPSSNGVLSGFAVIRQLRLSFLTFWRKFRGDE
jgi:hypothetical protein